MERHRRIEFPKPGDRDLPMPGAELEFEGTDFDYTKAHADDGWIDYNAEGKGAHGDPQTVKLDTSGL